MNAIDVAIHTTDTIIKTNIKGTICEIPAHQNLMSGQTQQCFKLSLIKKGNHYRCKKLNRTIYRKYSQSRRSDCTLIFKRKWSRRKWKINFWCYLSWYFQKNGRMDFIINSAEMLNIKLFKEKTDAEIFDEISTDYIWCINASKAAYHYLKLSHCGLLFFHQLLTYVVERCIRYTHQQRSLW